MMMVIAKTRCFVLLGTIIAASLTWINYNDDKTDDSFPSNQRALQAPPPTPRPTFKTLDLTCWKLNLPPGCNDTPKPTPEPTSQPPLPPSTSKPTPIPPAPTPPPVTYLFTAVRISDWTSKGYCTNTIKELNGVPASLTKEECCAELANGSENDLYNMCLSFDPIQLDECNDLNKFACKGSPMCHYNHYQDVCSMKCEGQSAELCRSREGCQYLADKRICSLSEEGYQASSCTRLPSKDECLERSGCRWNHYANNKQGQCQSACGGSSSENACLAIGGCVWDEGKGKCGFDIFGADKTGSPTPVPGPASEKSCPDMEKQVECKAHLPRCKWSSGKCNFACESEKESKCNSRFCNWIEDDSECLPRYDDYCEGLSETSCEQPLQCEWRRKAGCVTTCRARSKKLCDKKEASCKWDDEVEKCRYDHDAVVEDDADQKNANDASLSDRFVRGNLFHR